MPGFRFLETLRTTLGRSLDDLVCDRVVGAASDGKGEVTDASTLARNPAEQARLARYRRLPTRKRDAILELIKPE